MIAHTDLSSAFYPHLLTRIDFRSFDVSYGFLYPACELCVCKTIKQIKFILLVAACMYDKYFMVVLSCVCRAIKYQQLVTPGYCGLVVIMGEVLLFSFQVTGLSRQRYLVLCKRL
jgi:hypothetical protein